VGKITASAQTEGGLLLAELIKLLQNIDEQGKLAKLNETTISDNNGGRITL
jgi:hypothetical protein